MNPNPWNFLLLMVPKEWTFLSLFFLFLVFLFLFFFSHFFCLGLFLLGFGICCINWNLYFLDEESSGLVTWSRWWTMGYSRKKSKQSDREGWGHRFSSDIKEKTCGNSRSQLKSEIPWCSWKNRGTSTGLGFWPLEFPPAKDRFSTQSGKLGKVWKFVRALGKFRQTKFFLEKFGKGRRNFYPCKSLTSIEKPYGQRTVCDCIWQSVVSMMLLFASNTLLRWFNIANPFYFN